MKILSRTTYRRHMYQTHGVGELNIWQCEFCEKEFNEKSNLIRHTRSNHGKKFECTVCHLNNSNMHTLRRHMYQIHNVGVDNFLLCDYCEKTFTSKGNLSQHLKCAHEKKLKCEICHLNFGSKYMYKCHMSQTHNLDDQKILQCEHCEKTFTEKSNLNRHAKSAHM